MKIGILCGLGFVAGQKRIVGGVEVPPFKYGFMASIFLGDKFICGGVFVDPFHVITAAHCSNFTLADYRIQHHRHNLTLETGEERGESMEVAKIMANPLYIPETNMNDIAVFRLKKRVCGDMGHLRLDDGRIADAHGTMALAAGWGWEVEGGPNSEVLRQVEIPIVSYYDCYTKWFPHGYPVTEYSHVCAAGEGAKDVCKGDSGGPLFVKDAYGYVLVGTTSFGYPCAHEGFPTLFTRTASFLYFIKRSINSY